MTKKRVKNDVARNYKFDHSIGAYVEKQELIEAQAKPNAIIYARVSDKKQVEEGNGIESQIDNARNYANKNGITIIEIFKDEAVSGAKISREGLNEAVNFLKKQNKNYTKIGYFLCTEISRLSRSENIGETEARINEISNTGAKIIATFSGRDFSSKNSNDSFIADIDILQAKHERLKIRERSMNGTTSKLYNGERPFPVPAGYERNYVKIGRRTEKILEHKEPEAKILKEGLELFSEGMLTNNSQFLNFLNEKHFMSNAHSPNPGKLTLSFIERLFEIEKLYFYAGLILYPNREIMKPIDGQHEPLITLSTVNKILNRLQAKGKKIGIRKDTSDLYPLRGIVSCPFCDYAMTGRPTKGGTGKTYHYYGCNRKECKHKENNSVEKMHNDFIELLRSLTPKPGVINILEEILRTTIQNKDKIENNLKDNKRKRIREIEVELNNLTATIGKISKPEMINRLEEKRGDLNTEKDILEDELEKKGMEEKDFKKMYNKLKNIIEDPVSIRTMGTTEMKVLLGRVLFGEKIYYKKNEGYQTPQISALFNMFSTLEGGLVASKADDATRTRNQLLGRQGL